MKSENSISIEHETIGDLGKMLIAIRQSIEVDVSDSYLQLETLEEKASSFVVRR